MCFSSRAFGLLAAEVTAALWAGFPTEKAFTPVAKEAVP